MKPVSWVVAVAMVYPLVGVRSVSADLGQQIATQGNDRGATACQACHGPDGMGNAAAGFPRLAGLNSEYLNRQLQDYQSGARSNPVMQPIASALDQTEKAAVSTYYAEQDAIPAPLIGRADRIPQSLGERLATRGAWERGIPECMSCHGPGGAGVGAVFPRLAGQHASYIVQQLTAWKQGTRTNDPNQLMGPVAEKLTEDESAAVGDYFSRLGTPNGTIK